MIAQFLSDVAGGIANKIWLWWMDHGGDKKDDAEEKKIEEGKS